MTIGERIRFKRIELGISQTALADKVGILKQNLYKYEKNIITNIPYDTLEKIALALNTSPAWLAGWEKTNNDTTVFLQCFDTLNENDKKFVIEIMNLIKNSSD